MCAYARVRYVTYAAPCMTLQVLTVLLLLLSWGTS